VLKSHVAEVKPDAEQEITVRKLALERESRIVERELIVTLKIHETIYLNANTNYL
jgi:hypothetical protein